MQKQVLWSSIFLLLLTLMGCQKQQKQTDVRLPKPEPEPAVTEETITEPLEKPEGALPTESGKEQEPQSKMFTCGFGIDVLKSPSI